MKILVTGDYDPSYNRTRIILKGLRSLEVEVEEFPFKKLSKSDKADLIEKCEWADIIYLPPFTHPSVKVIKKLTSKPVVFDPLISKYMTKVFDYKQVSRFSPRAIKNFYKDKIPLRKSDLIIADTLQHKDYFARKFKLDLQKIHVLPIGVVQDDFMASYKTPEKVFTVGFYGGFIPLQGVMKIIEAAILLRGENDIRFSLIGNGFEYKKILKRAQKEKLSNISFEGYIEYDMLSNAISNYDMCLGIFGETMKADLVIPNKVYHYAAMGKCILTKDTPAIRELFDDNENIILCSNDPKDIAEKIQYIKNDTKLRENIGSRAHELISGKYNENEIASRFLEIVSNLV